MGDEFLITFGWISLMLVIGGILRYKVRLLQSMLIPGSAIGGILGYILINTGVIQVSTSMLQVFAAQLFIISFISLGLTGMGSSGNKGSVNKGGKIFKGAIWFMIIWFLAFGLQAIIGSGTIMGLNLFGNKIDVTYGLLLPFGFAMGTGQAITYGTIVENAGYTNAAQVALTFGVIGYMVSIFIGVPLANWAVRKGIAKNADKLSDELLVGVFRRDQRKRAGELTFHSSNIDTLAFHLGMIGIVYLVSYKFIHWFGPLWSPQIENMIIGVHYMFAIALAFVFSWGMKKTKSDHFLSTDLMKIITGWTVDFMVVSSFMAISFMSVKGFILPIVSITLIGTIVTIGICFYFGKRIGGDHDLESSFAIFGMNAGQVPNALLLLRLVDPRYKSSAATELALMNAITPPVLVFLVLIPILWGWNIISTVSLLSGIIIICLILLKVLNLWGKPTYSFFGKENNTNQNNNQETNIS